MAIQERVSRLEGEQAGIAADLNAFRSDMNLRFSIMFGLLIATLGVKATLLGIGVTLLLRM